jgi:hypothetical protein
MGCVNVLRYQTTVLKSMVRKTEDDNCETEKFCKAFEVH